MDRVLLVEDDPLTLEVLTACLELDDYQVRTAAALSGGVELLQREPFDLILTDLFAPSFSAQALIELKAFTQAVPQTPVVVATAHAEAGTFDPTRYGLAAIILKPFRLDDFHTRLRSVLDERQQRLQALHRLSNRALDHYRSAQGHIGDSTALLGGVQFPPPPTAL